MLPHEYSAYRHKFIDLLARIESMWDGYLGSIKPVKYLVELKRIDNKRKHLAPYRPARSQRELKKQMISRMLEMNIIEPIQTELASTIVLNPEKEEAFHFCVVKCKLNEVMVQLSYSILGTGKCINSRGDAMIFWHWVLTASARTSRLPRTIDIKPTSHLTKGSYVSLACPSY